MSTEMGRAKKTIPANRQTESSVNTTAAPPMTEPICSGFFFPEITGDQDGDAHCELCHNKGDEV